MLYPDWGIMSQLCKILLLLASSSRKLLGFSLDCKASWMGYWPFWRKHFEKRFCIPFRNALLKITYSKNLLTRIIDKNSSLFYIHSHWYMCIHKQYLCHLIYSKNYFYKLFFKNTMCEIRPLHLRYTRYFGL